MAEVPSLESLISNLELAVEKTASSTNPIRPQLRDTITKIKSDLEKLYNVSGETITPELQGSSYSQMLMDLNPDFISLFSTLTRMRSSFLPVELVNEITRPDGSNISLSQILETDADKESFENVFFRLIGMPKSDELEDELIKSISIQGEVVTLSKVDIERRLNDRQITIANRARYPSFDIFVFGNQTYFESFAQIFDSKGIQDDLLEISDILNKIFNTTIKDNAKIQEYHDQISAILDEYAIQKYDDGESITEEHKQIITDCFNQLLDASVEGQQSETNTDLAQTIVLNIFSSSLSIMTEGKDISFIFDGLFNELVLKVSNQSIDNLADPNNFWRFSYLLFPPIQDGRISKCLNDPARLVAPLFLPETQRVVNKNNMKPSLLEAIIRIRLDISAGTNRGAPGAEQFSLANIGDDKNLKYRDIQDVYGLLEAIFISRLFAALQGMAINILQNIENIKIEQSQTNIKLTGESPKTDNSQADTNAPSDPTKPVPEDSPELKKLKQQASFEEAILLLLGQNSVPDAISFQEGVGLLRTSNIKDSYLMSTVIDLVSIPLEWANKKIGKTNSDNSSRGRGSTAYSTGQVANKLGISKGVGSLDVLVFLIALFSSSELTLLSLLNEEEFNNLKKQFPRNYFIDIDGKEIVRKTKAKAVEEVSLLAIDAYNFFRFLLEQPLPIKFGLEENTPLDAKIEDPVDTETTIA
jgi:DNA replication initiation complex subunit (GINS family)